MAITKQEAQEMLFNVDDRVKYGSNMYRIVGVETEPSYGVGLHRSGTVTYGIISDPVTGGEAKVSLNQLERLEYEIVPLAERSIEDMDPKDVYIPVFGDYKKWKDVKPVEIKQLTDAGRLGPYDNPFYTRKLKEEC